MQRQSNNFCPQFSDEECILVLVQWESYIAGRFSIRKSTGYYYFQKELMNMANPELLTKLYQKMGAEQEQYRNWLLGQPPGDILNHAAAYAVREDIVMEMSALELPDEQTKALLKSKAPLADIYNEWNNAIEGFNRQLRKVTKAKSVFPTDDSLLKMLYLAMMDITRKWTGRRQDWSVIHAQLAVYFADRMPD